MSVLTLSDAKTHLNIASSTQDGELVRFIEAAEAAIAQRVGPLAATAVTERVEGCTYTLAVTTLPVISLTSVTPVGGSALTLADLWLSPAGLVRYPASNVWFGSLHYDVAYSAGRATCPDDLLLAVKELVRHLWDTQRGGARRPGSPQSDSLSNTLPGAAYAFPIRVSELIAPHELSSVGGFA